MPVFKLYMKFCLKKWKLILVYFMIGFIQFGLCYMNIQNSQTSQFQTKTTMIAVLDEDHTQYSEVLISYLKKYHHVMMMNSMDEIEDALYYRKISFCVQIPKNFSHAMDTVTTSYDASNIDAIYAKQNLEEILNTMNKYRLAYPDKSIVEISEMMDEVLSLQSNIKLLKEANQGEYDELAAMINFTSYTVFATLFSCIGYAMYTLQEKAPFKKLLCSSVRVRSILLQSFLATGVITFMVYALYMVVIASISIPYMFTKEGLYMMGICFILYIALGSIVLFISCITAFKQAASIDFISMLGTIIPLICSFIGGVFVSQMYMQDFLLKLASFTPIYWFVQMIESLASKTYTNMQIIECITILCLFTIVCLLGAMFSLKRYVKHYI